MVVQLSLQGIVNDHVCLKCMVVTMGTCRCVGGCREAECGSSSDLEYGSYRR